MASERGVVTVDQLLRECQTRFATASVGGVLGHHLVRARAVWALGRQWGVLELAAAHGARPKTVIVAARASAARARALAL